MFGLRSGLRVALRAVLIAFFAVLLAPLGHT